MEGQVVLFKTFIFYFFILVVSFICSKVVRFLSSKNSFTFRTDRNSSLVSLVKTTIFTFRSGFWLSHIISFLIIIVLIAHIPLFESFIYSGQLVQSSLFNVNYPILTILVASSLTILFKYYPNDEVSLYEFKKFRSVMLFRLCLGYLLLSLSFTEVILVTGAKNFADLSNLQFDLIGWNIFRFPISFISSFIGCSLLLSISNDESTEILLKDKYQVGTSFVEGTLVSSLFKLFLSLVAVFFFLGGYDVAFNTSSNDFVIRILQYIALIIKTSLLAILFELFSFRLANFSLSSFYLKSMKVLVPLLFISLIVNLYRSGVI